MNIKDEKLLFFPSNASLNLVSVVTQVCEDGSLCDSSL